MSWKKSGWVEVKNLLEKGLGALGRIKLYEMEPLQNYDMKLNTFKDIRNGGELFGWKTDADKTKVN